MEIDATGATGSDNDIYASDDPQLEESRAHDNKINENGDSAPLTMTQMITETTATCPSGTLINLWILIYFLLISKVSSNFVIQFQILLRCNLRKFRKRKMPEPRRKLEPLWNLFRSRPHQGNERIGTLMMRIMMRCRQRETRYVRITTPLSGFQSFIHFDLDRCRR